MKGIKLLSMAGAVVACGQVERSAALAGRHHRHDGRDLGEARRVEAQDLGAVGGEEAGADGPGDHPRQVEDPHPTEGAASPPGVPRPRRVREGGARKRPGPPHTEEGPHP